MEIHDWEHKTIDELAELMVQKFPHLLGRKRSDKKQQIKRVLQGRCRLCGRENAPNRTKCPNCLQRENKKMHRRRARLYGTHCIKCARELMPERKEAGRVTCQFCAQNTKESLKYRGDNNRSPMWNL